MRKGLPTTYYVWRRVSPSKPELDGYVGICTYNPNDLHCLSWESYDILLETSDFDMAQKLTVAEQAKDERYKDD